MTGYESKKAMAQDKLEQWGNEAFNAWWDSDSDGGSANPFSDDTFAYWAWAGWQAALAQPAQEPVAWMVYTKDGQSVYVTDNPTDIQESQRALPLYITPLQRPWVDLTGNEWFEWWRVSKVADETEAEIDFADFITIALAVAAKLKEENNG